MQTNCKRNLSLVSLSILCTFVFDCGISVTERARLKIPSETETEVFRLNLFDGEVKNLYGVNIGLLNRVLENLIGLQVGGANVADGKTSAQVGGRTVRENKEVYVAQIGGVKIGVLNISPSGLSIGAINVGERDNFLIGILNFCDDFPTVMIGFNYCWRLGGW
ncbi:hypothetical protein LEP1GSC162_0528 [Leptospira santarosai str. CBC1531]|uniref:LA_2272/LA_2273 family lipoprotein n=1 Tax=Leptospira santarosai TaxID=28183 RepID=UPI0002BE3373|nr:hypothetical protein [Leptospira santarosai]EMP81516.1 hypothetical protein LEP1GSC162_0528 [Leptospira santarosai str. CBC1531]